MTVLIDDINDHVPVFTQSIYRAVMSESYGVGASIISISATDADTGSNARLLYSLREQDREHFIVTSVEATNTGVLKVHRVSESTVCFGQRNYACKLPSKVPGSTPSCGSIR